MALALRAAKSGAGALALRAKSAKTPSDNAGAAKQEAKQGVAVEMPEAEDSSAARLFELVRMIRDWIERSFAPGQAARLEDKGRLCARFQVELGQAMADSLRAYIAASFALRLLRLRVTEVEGPRGAAKHSVEVIVSREARALYEQKHPEACAKHAQQLQPSSCGAEAGLVDADEDRASIEPAKLDELQDKKREHSQDKLAKVERIQDKQEVRQAPASSEGSVAARVSAVDAKSRAQERAFGKRQAAQMSANGPLGGAAKRGVTSSLPALADGAPPAKRRVSSSLPALADGAPPASQIPIEAQVMSVPTPTKRIALPTNTRSVWEACEAREVPEGIAGLEEARDALENFRAAQSRGGLDALRAEEEVVAWLKGLASRDIGTHELRETKIGLAVNAWRKHREAYISTLASSLLGAWKQAWREAERAERRKSI